MDMSRPRSHRIGSALAAVAVEAAIVYALILGLAVRFATPADETMKLFNAVPPPPPHPESIRPEQHREAHTRAASPPSLRARPTEIVVPPPIVRIVVPPIVSIDKAGTGDASAGAGATPGSGPGSGGTGNGDGGIGDGSGGDETPPRRRRGNLSNADFPASVSARASDFHGTVSVRYVVAATGRVTQCGITRSSGDADVDTTTCRLIEKRFRFDPSRDAEGRPVAAMVVENHSWDIEHDRVPPRS